SARLLGLDDGSIARQFAGPAQADAGLAVELCGAGLVVGGRRHLRRDRLYGQTAHARVRRSAGVGRAGGRRAAVDSSARIEADFDRVRAWINRRFRADAMDGKSVVRRAPCRPTDVWPDRARVAAGGDLRLLDSGAKGDASRSAGRATLGVSRACVK